MTNDAIGPVFEGLRVVEISQGMAGPMVGQLLADNGADVVKIEPRDGDWARVTPGFRMWNRGKRSVALDLSQRDDRERALELVDGADVLIETVRGGTARALGHSYEELAKRNPRLVHCTISGFGPAERWEDLPSYEGIVAARIGRFLGAQPLSGLSEVNAGPRPIFNITPFGSYASSCIGLVGIVGALRTRATTGRGMHVETSMLEGICAATMRVPFRRQGEKVMSVDDTRGRDVVFRGIKLAFMTAKCSDGRYIQMCARQPDHYQRWLRGIGLGELLDDPRYAKGPTGFKSLEDVDELEALIRKAMGEKTQGEWMELFAGEFDVGADPFLTPAEFLEMADMVDNGRVVEIDDPEVGLSKQVGPLALLERSASTIGRPAPRLGEHDDAAWGGALSSAPAGASDALAPPPLAGITVLEAAYFVAGPLGAATLAELGARVIKLEPINGDPFRATMTEFAQISHGKESVAIDLKHPRSREIVDRVLGKADVLLHSFRPGVSERLGLDYEHVHSINPALVYLYAGSYGSKGPQSQRPAFHSTPNALCGAGIAQAGEGNPPVDDSYPDPCSALGVATALAIGLHARERTGEGQSMETTMLTATGYVHSDMVVQYPGRPPTRVQDAGQHGFTALYRLYQCESGWIFLAAVQQHEWEALASAVEHEEWLTDARFATAAARATNDEELTDALAEIFATRSAGDWQAHLIDRGVPATRADEETFEEFVVANVPHEPMTHPAFGDSWRRAPTSRFSGCEPVVPSGAPSVGEHTLSVLADLGYSDEECQELIDGGAVKAAEKPSS